MMMTEQNLEIARYSLQDRIRYAEQHELRRQRRRAAKQSSPGPRHRIAAALHRLVRPDRAAAAAPPAHAVPDRPVSPRKARTWLPQAPVLAFRRLGAPSVR